MNILVASAEVSPLAKTGGLGDVTASLPKDWQKFGQNPIIILPKYGFIDTDLYGFKPTDIILYVPIGNWVEYARLWFGKLPDSNVPVYLVENQDYFLRHGIYGEPKEYEDNDRRFIFFSRAIFETAKAINFSPDIIHAHDFHTAFTMAFLKSQYRYHPLFSKTAGVYTIHNLAYQGWFDAGRAMWYSTFGMGQFYPGSWFERYGSVNAMKTGIMFADKITTVSPTYSYEIRLPYFSEGMQDVLNFRGGDLIGVLNGVDYSEWSPENDSNIYCKYNTNSLDNKLINKYSFLRERGLTENDNLDLPLVGMVSRLTEQKGIDILTYKLEEIIASNRIRFAILGSGEHRYESYFYYLQSKYPDKVFVTIGYDNRLSHRIIASSDFLVLPSRFEPCGLTQLYALKYGTIPVVRSTGGLADSVFEYIPKIGKGNGFVFWHYNADDFAYSLRRALDIYNDKFHWDVIRKNAMAEDNSSSRSAFEYLKVFNWALEKVH